MKIALLTMPLIAWFVEPVQADQAEQADPIDETGTCDLDGGGPGGGGSVGGLGSLETWTCTRFCVWSVCLTCCTGTDPTGTWTICS
jgi:hypothetical protein